MEKVEEYKITADDLVIPIAILGGRGIVKQYHVYMPTIAPGTKALIDYIKHGLVTEVSISTQEILDPKAISILKEKFTKRAQILLKDKLPTISQDTATLLINILMQEMLGLGDVEYLLADEQLEEIVITSSKEPVRVYHKKHGWLETNIVLENEDKILNYANIIGRRVGRQITTLNPLLDAHLVTGDRANAVLFPICTKGHTITIRRFARDPWTLVDFIKNNTVTSKLLALIWLAIQYEMNVLISGGTASGKCLSGDTEVYLTHRKQKIKDVVEDVMKSSNPEKIDDGYVSACDLELLSFNPITLKIEKKRASHAWKRTSPTYLYKIQTASGRTITVTPEHPFFVSRGGGQFLRADQITERTTIAVPRIIALQSSLPHFDLLQLPGKIFEENEQSIALKGKGSTKKIRVPKYSSTDLMRFLGYIAGDGHITKNKKHVRFFNNDKELLNDVQQLGKKIFDLEGHIKKYGQKTPYVQFSSIFLGEFLTTVVGIPAGNKSHIVHLSENLLLAPKEQVNEFILGLFESEASIHKKKKELEFSSASEKLVENVAFILSRNGVLHHFRHEKTRSRLFIGGKNLKEYAQQIGLFSSTKKNLLKETTSSTFDSPNFDFVPGIAKEVLYLCNAMRLRHDDIKGTLSRRAVTRYTAGERNPQRSSLKIVSEELMKHYQNLLSFKKILDTRFNGSHLLHLLQNIREKTYLPWNSLAKNAGVDKSTLYLWFSSKVQPSEKIYDVAKSVMVDYNHYYALCASNNISPQTLRIEGKDIAQELGVPRDFIYPYLRGERSENSISSKEISKVLSSIKNRRIYELKGVNELVHQVSEIITHLQNNNFSDTLEEIRTTHRLQNKSQKEIYRFLQSATREEVFKKIKNLQRLSESDILWDEIRSIKKIRSKEKWVYDLTVDGNHTFVANNVVVHNTSFLNICMPFIPHNHRIVSIEDSVDGNALLMYQENDRVHRKPIGEFIDMQLRTKKTVLVDGTEVTPNENIQIYSVDRTGKVIWSKPSSFIRHHIKKNMYTIITATGRKIRVTGDHSLFSLINNEILPVRCADLKVDDFLATPRTLPFQGKHQTFDLAEYLHFFKQFQLDGEGLRDFLLPHKKFLLTRRSKAQVNSYFKLQRIPISLFLELRIPLPHHLKKILQIIPLRSGRYRRVGVPLIIPMTKDLACLAGLWLADGSYDRNSTIFSVVEPECNKFVEKVAHDVLHTKPRLHSDGLSLMINSAVFKQFFRCVLGLDGNAYTKRVPFWVFNLLNEELSFFLRGYISGDGWPRSNDIAASSCSLGLLEDIQVLWLRLGIIFRLSRHQYPDKTYQGFVSGSKFLQMFSDLGGFLQQRQNEKLFHAIKSEKDTSDIIPLAKPSYLLLKHAFGSNFKKSKNYTSWKNWQGMYRKSHIGRSMLQELIRIFLPTEISFLNTPHLEKIKPLVFNDLFWDRIISITNEPFEGYVYDLSVPDTENFICENIVCHNTRELQLPKYLYWCPLTVRQPNPEGKGAVEMLDLLVNSLRMRPDRIILGEMRKKDQAEVLFEAMHTGHSVYATVHADSVAETIERLVNAPIEVPQNLLLGVNLNVVMFRDRRRGLRRVFQVGEFLPTVEEGVARIRPNILYRWKPSTDEIVEHGTSSRLFEELSRHTGMTLAQIEKDILKKKAVLDWMVKNNIRHVDKVGEVIRNYYLDPDSIFEQIGRVEGVS